MLFSAATMFSLLTHSRDKYGTPKHSNFWNLANLGAWYLGVSFVSILGILGSQIFGLAVRLIQLLGFCI